MPSSLNTTTTRHRSLSGALIDTEKRRVSTDSDYAPSYAPPRSDPDQPMLGDLPSPKKYNALRYQLPRRRFTRYFTVAISTTLIVLALYLITSSWSSETQVRLGLKKPPPPPAAWEQFPFLKRYHGGIRTLVARSDNRPEYPNPDAEAEQIEELRKAAMDRKSKDDQRLDPKSGFNKREVPAGIRFDPLASEAETEFELPVKCYLDKEKKLDIPQLLAYKGVTKGFPDPVMGSYDLLGLRNDVCFERYGRLGPYGYGYSKKFGGTGAGMEGDMEGSKQVWGDELEVNYRNVKWADARAQCEEANSQRFRPASSASNHLYNSMATGGPQKDSEKQAREEEPHGPNGKRLVSRTAVIIRTWHDYKYDAEDLLYLRALMNELMLQSGAEYVVHFLIHVKDDNLQIWADEQTYQKTLDDALPEEFRGMGTLWSERQMGLIYGGLHESMYRNLPVHGAYRSTYMPLQYFAHMHPEYDFFWHWEMDVRYTGHFYHLFDKVSKWAKQQPRKGLWERNGRFYIPSEHGSWDDFKHQVRIESEKGTASKQTMYEKLAADAGAKHPLDTEARKPQVQVWGHQRPTGWGDKTYDPESDPEPPTSYENDKYEWGVGEEADLITFNPLFDPHNTNWILAEDTTGYNTTKSYPPRRTAIITASRLSKRLLNTMHYETAMQRHTMFSEMWPGSCALHHGYKAVYAPHPVYIDRRWPTSYLTAVFNNGLHGAAGGARTSVFSDERQHNFLGTTWYYHAGFSPNLWKRWFGYKVDNDGGEQWEVAHEGRMCMPAMLLHPVKQVDLIIEHLEGE